GSYALTFLLNAADWGGGHAGAPHEGFGRSPNALRRSDGERLSALLTQWPRQPEVQPVRVTTDLPSNTVQQASLQIQAIPSAYAEATFDPGPLRAPRHAQEAVFEHWGGPLADVLATD